MIDLGQRGSGVCCRVRLSCGTPPSAPHEEPHAQGHNDGEAEDHEEDLHPSASRKTSERCLLAKLNSVTFPAFLAALRTSSLSVVSERTKRIAPPDTSETVTPAKSSAQSPLRSPSIRTSSLRAPLVSSSSTVPET